MGVWYGSSVPSIAEHGFYPFIPVRQSGMNDSRPESKKDMIHNCQGKGVYFVFSLSIMRFYRMTYRLCLIHARCNGYLSRPAHVRHMPNCQLTVTIETQPKA